MIFGTPPPVASSRGESAMRSTSSIRSVRAALLVAFAGATLGASVAAAKPTRPRASRLFASAGYLFQVNQRSEEHTSELQSPCNLVCRLLLEKKKKNKKLYTSIHLDMF